MDSILDSPRIRISLFAVVVVLLGALAIWTLSSGDDSGGSAVETVSPEEPELQEPVAPGDISAPKPQPSMATSGSSITTEDVTKFLRATRTYSWRDDLVSLSAKAVRNGAVPGSQAASPPVRGEALSQCIADRCSSTFVGARNVVIGVEEITAEVTLRQEANGKVQEDVVFCSVFPSASPSTESGLFVKTSCLGPGG
jgi:hypothetical protein